MRFIVIDLIPALLQWEGRDSFGLATAQPHALEMVHSLFHEFRLAAITDGDHPASAVREALERQDLSAYFESVGTSSVFGPTVTPRVVRRVARAIGGTGRTIAISARPALVEALRRSGIPTVGATGDLLDTADAVRRMAFGKISP
jgi:FMN phosphatase YigB (HAD superfamily)